MALCWWRALLCPRRRYRARCRAQLHLERFEERAVPSANTYQWTGAGLSNSWSDPGNWMPVNGATGAFPGDGVGAGDVAKFLDPPTALSVVVNGAFTLGEIDFGDPFNIKLVGDTTPGDGLTLTGSAQIVSADSFGGPNTGVDEISAPLFVPNSLTVINSASFSGAQVELDSVVLSSGASLTTSGTNNVQISSLTTDGSNTLTVQTSTQLGSFNSSSPADTLALGGTGTLNLPGPSTFAGTVILSGASVVIGSNFSLGLGGVALSSGALAASFPGLGLNNPLALLPGGSIALGDPVDGISLAGAYKLPSTFTIQNNGGATLDGPGSLNGTANLAVNGSPLEMTGDLTLTGNSTLDLSGSGSLIEAGNVHLGTRTLTLGASAPLTMTGNLVGSGALTVSGPGTTILDGNVSYTGPTSILGGTLQLGDGSVALTPLATPSILDNGTLIFEDLGGQTESYSGTISGTGSLTQTGTWTLNLSGNNSYTGATIIGPGATLDALGNTALGNGDVTVEGTGTLNVQTPGPMVSDLGAGLSGSYYSLLGATTYPPPAFNSQASLLAFVATLGTPAATDTSALSNGQNDGGATFDYGSTGAGFPAAVRRLNQVSGSPTQFMGLWQGVFFAPVAGSYTFDTGSDDGSMLFIDGKVVVNNNVNQFLTVRHGAVNLSAGAHAIVLAYYQRIDGYGFFADVQGPGLPQERLPNALLGTVAPTLLQLGSLTGSGTINLAQSASTPNNALLVGSDNNSSFFDGTINSLGTNPSGFPNLIKAGTGNLVLGSGENYTGKTVISKGVLQLGTPATPIASLPTNSIFDNSNLTLYLPPSLTYNGVISGAGGVTLGGAGSTLGLGGANSYSGPTLVGGNTIQQLAANTLPPHSAFTLGSGSNSGTVDLNGFNGALSSIASVGVGTSNTLTNSSSTPATVTLNGLGFPVNTNVAIAGPLSVIFGGSGTEFLSGTNSYTGSTVLLGSMVVLGSSTALPAGTALLVSGSGVLDLDGQSISVASLGGVGTVNTITNSSPTLATLTITGATGGFYTGAITGAINLNDAGAATATTTLAGGSKNTFSGGVTATSGVLVGVPGSFGTGPSVLAGGALELAPVGAAVAFGGNGSGWTLNNVGGGTLFPAPDVLQLTNSAGPEASSLFYDTPVQPVGGFSASFTYQDQSPDNSNPGDGITFTLQADPLGPFALGGSGGSFGFGPGGSATNPDGSIKNSVGVALNLDSSVPGGVGTALVTNGTLGAMVNPGGSFDLLTSGDPIQVTFTYDGGAQTLTESLLDNLTGAAAYTEFFGVNLFSLLGSYDAFVGITGSTGTENATQVVSQFVYVNAAGPGTTFTNNLQATAGATMSLPLVVNPLANSYTTTGNLNVPHSAIVNITGNGTPNLPYTLSVTGNTTLVGTVNLTNNGSGSATLSLNGSLSGVGTAIGAIGGNGNLTLGANSNYTVVLGGTSAGQFTSLNVGGAVNLQGGNLVLEFANGYAPPQGQSFTIVQAGGPITGTFAQGTTFSAGGQIYTITYGSGTHPSIIITPITSVVATRLVITAPHTATAGVPFTAFVAAEDDAGNIAGDFNQIVSLSSSAGGMTPASVMLIGGTASPLVTLTNAGTQTLTASFPGLIPGTTVITISAAAFAEYEVTDPQVPAGTPFLIQVQAADAYGNAISNYTGPSTVQVSVTPATTAGTFPLTVSMGSSGLGFVLGSLDQVGSYQLTANSGTYGSNAAAVTVVPGPATKLGFSVEPVNGTIGSPLPPVSVTVTDAYGNVITSDNSDTVVLSIVSGPGLNFAPGSITSAPVINGVATFTDLAFRRPGSYTLAAVVPTLYSGPFSSSFTIAPVQVVTGSFTSSPTGFSVNLTAPIEVNSTTPVLYGSGFGSNAPAPSVTLTQIADASGNPITPVPVEGSLIVDPTDTVLTFVATDTAYETNNNSPLLPDGTYQVTIAGTGPGALLGPGGIALDGTNSGFAGSDYTTFFTVAASTSDVLWTPATAVGPGQPLVAPGSGAAGGGYPVYLNDTTGNVTSIAATFTYNPALLTVTPSSGGGFTVAVPTPGTALLSYAGPALAAGTQVPVGYLGATVPAGSIASPMPYKAKDLLTLANVSLDGGSIPAVGTQALHLVAYVGDVDGSGGYSANDGVLITRAALQVDSGFVAYPLVDPVIVADTDGSGFIPADAGLQANEAGVGFPTANLPSPPVPANAQFLPISNNVDPTLSLPSSLTVGQGGVVTVPVNLDDPHPAGSTGLTIADLALTFDPTRFSVSPADIHLGSLLAGQSGWNLVTTIDSVTGQIAIALTSTTPLTSTAAGSLVTISFHSISGEPGALATGGATTPIALVASVTPNGGFFVTNLQDQQGTFVLTPAPTNGPTARIESNVTLQQTPSLTPDIREPVSAGEDLLPRTAETQAGASPTDDSPRFAITNALNNGIEVEEDGPVLASPDLLPTYTLWIGGNAVLLPGIVADGVDQSLVAAGSLVSDSSRLALDAVFEEQKAQGPEWADPVLDIGKPHSLLDSGSLDRLFALETQEE